MMQSQSPTDGPITYERLSIREEVPADAVALALSPDGETLATRLIWQSLQGKQAETGPASVPSALELARKRAAEHGKARIVIYLERGAAWNEDWGRLRTAQMEREPLGDLTGAAPTDGRQLQDEEYFTAALIQELERDA